MPCEAGHSFAAGIAGSLVCMGHRNHEEAELRTQQAWNKDFEKIKTIAGQGRVGRSKDSKQLI